MYLPDGSEIQGGFPFSTQTILAEFNDAGNTFAKIADWIEENL
jgi:hypothetical protein